MTTVLGSTSEMLPLHAPEFQGNEWQYVRECLDTGWVSSVGSFVDRFERDLATFTGIPYAVATSNGTSALHVCLLLAGVRPSDEVLIPTLTFVATANAVAYTGATPHFVDSECQGLGVDPEKLDDYLSEIALVKAGECFNRLSGRVMRALVVMHAFGHPCDMEALTALADKWHLVLVEDAAESLGSYFQGRHTGSWGRISALSFNGNKIITTGGGGAILTGDPLLARRAKHLTTTARVAHRWSFNHDEVGFNYRLPNINAALGCAQIERLPSMLARKRSLAAAYMSAFAAVDGIRFVVEPDGSTSNYWLNSIALSPALEEERDAILSALNDAGYMSRPIWTLMHSLPMYRSAPKMDTTVAEGLQRSVVNLPSSPSLAMRVSR